VKLISCDPSCHDETSWCLMRCELLPWLLGDLSSRWILQSQSLSRGISLDIPLLTPTYLHMAFGNLLFPRLLLLCQKQTCHHKRLHHLDKDSHSAVGDQEEAVCLHVPLHTILLRIKLLCPLYSSSSSFHRTPLRCSRSLFSQFLDLGTLTLRYHMQIFFMMLAYVNVNAHVEYRLLSPQ